MGIKGGTCLYSKAEGESSRWHERLGHIKTETIQNMMQKELVEGIPKGFVEKKLCGSCLLGKQARQAFPKSTSYRATKPLELLHGDLCGPTSLMTQDGNRYIFVVIDDHTSYMSSMLLKEKSEAFSKFKKLRITIEKEIGEKIQTFITDRGGEFVIHEFDGYCEGAGIRRHLTALYTPQ